MSKIHNPSVQTSTLHPPPSPQTAGQFIDLWLRQTIREMQEVLYKISRHFTNHGILTAGYHTRIDVCFILRCCTQHTLLNIPVFIETPLWTQHQVINEGKKLPQTHHCR